MVKGPGPPPGHRYGRPVLRGSLRIGSAPSDTSAQYGIVCGREASYSRDRGPLVPDIRSPKPAIMTGRPADRPPRCAGRRPSARWWLRRGPRTPDSDDGNGDIAQICYLGLPVGLARVVLITCLIVGIVSLSVTAGRGLRMWEDFVRGNWPAAASAMPDPEQLPSPKPTAVKPAQPQAQVTPRPAAGKLAFRAALAAGAGLVLAVAVPGSAVAGIIHSTGAHAVGGHIAAHAATSP
jgi:hypothetical protein